jgi:hypothetical protein
MPATSNPYQACVVKREKMFPGEDLHRLNVLKNGSSDLISGMQRPTGFREPVPETESG